MRHTRQCAHTRVHNLIRTELGRWKVVATDRIVKLYVIYALPLKTPLSIMQLMRKYISRRECASRSSISITRSAVTKTLRVLPYRSNFRFLHSLHVNERSANTERQWLSFPSV